MNATSAPAVRRPASTSRPPNQKMLTSASRNTSPTSVQKALVSTSAWRAMPNTRSVSPV